MFSKPIKTTPFERHVPLTADGVPVLACVVESAGNGYEINAAGFHRSDIARLNAAQSLQEYQLLLTRLQAYQANNPDNSKISTEKLIRGIMPWRAQTPSEVSDMADRLGRDLQADLDEQVRDLEEKQAVEAAKTGVNVTPVDPAASVTTT